MNVCLTNLIDRLFECIDVDHNIFVRLRGLDFLIGLWRIFFAPLSHGFKLVLDKQVENLEVMLVFGLSLGLELVLVGCQNRKWMHEWSCELRTLSLILKVKIRLVDPQ